MVLTPPFEPMLAQAAEYVPGSGVLASGFAAEQKFDGHRAILFTPAGPGGRLLLQTRRGSLVQDRFPDLVSAAEQLPEGLVLDGELVVWDTAAGRLSFEALQRRAAARGRTATALAAKTPRSSSPSTPCRSTASSCWPCPTPSAADAWRSSSRPAH
ncbi:hypothetical protein WKI68_12910 [Streptomyces sp. MS1.HAVA.3]|uniref:ATP-dependent DNA ligase family profile domain-containing protein n=1 Tax=Streptomyces caledonius TaxID=3134107 RepID=A0ABU8U2M5_9ACTN